MTEDRPELPPLWSAPAPVRHNGGPPLDIPRRCGRPTVLTEEVRDRIGELLLDGIPVRVICRTQGMPSRATIYRWCRLDPDFASLFRFMQTEGYILLAEKVFEEVERLIDTRGVKVARLIFNLRRQQLSRMNPAYFGDREMKC
jgi:hypothetical protein